MDNYMSGLRSQANDAFFKDANLLALLKGHEQHYPKQLSEQYPQIVERIVAVWSSPDTARSYFQNLLMTDRNTRQGFPSQVYTELLALSMLYDRLFPPKPKPEAIRRDPWETGGGGRIR
jgi:hypothetical protein